MYPLKQSTALTVLLFAHDVNGDAVNSLTDGTWTKRISKNGGAFAAMTVTITYLENGWYSVPLSTAHTDTLGIISMTFTNAGCKQVNMQFRVFARINDDFAYPVTSGRGMVVDAAGLVDSNVVKLGPTGAGTAQTARDVGAQLDATISSRMATYTQPTGFLAATFPTTVASTTNITAGTITTVTNLTNAPTAGDLTATMKSSVTTAATAATPTAAAVTGSVGSVAGDVAGKVLGGGAGTITGTGVRAVDGSGNAIAPASTALDNTVWTGAKAAFLDAAVTSRMATYTQPTGFLAATFPTTVASPTNITSGTITTVTNLTNAPTVGDLTATMKASVTTAATAATPVAASVSGNVVGRVLGSGATAFVGSGVQALDSSGNAIAPASTALSSAVWTGTKAGYVDAAISGRMASYTQPTGFLAATFPASVAAVGSAMTLASDAIDDAKVLRVRGVVVTDAGNTALTFKTDFASTINDAYKDMILKIRSGTLIEQVKKVTAYNGTTKFITVQGGFTGVPAVGVSLDLINGA